MNSDKSSRPLANTIKLGDHSFETLLAITSAEQERGLMGVPPPAPVMTFIYGTPSYNQFWMHRTFSPLDIVFALNGKITAIRPGIPHSTALISSGGMSDMVVELPGGTCASRDIKVGDKVEASFDDRVNMSLLTLKTGIRL
jgi:uncharacterized membrane protein (UPF0127 family)